MTYGNRDITCDGLPFIHAEDVEETIAFYLRRAIARYGIGISHFRGGTPNDEAIKLVVDEICDHASDNLKRISLERVEDEFVAGWREAGGYVGDLEAGCPTPWCAPWTYQGWVWQNELAEGLSPRDRGAHYWDEHRDEVLEELAREAEAKALEEEDAS